MAAMRSPLMPTSARKAGLVPEPSITEPPQMSTSKSMSGQDLSGWSNAARSSPGAHSEQCRPTSVHAGRRPALLRMFETQLRISYAPGKAKWHALKSQGRGVGFLDSNAIAV